MNTYQPRAPHPGRRAAEPVTWPDSATSCNRLGTRGEGIRIEELTELSHHSLIRCQLPGDGQLIPLLHIAPSKTDIERMLVISPELTEVLAIIVARVRSPETGAVPLVTA